MGIAAAFATGLVQGFSENIDKEQARRDKQRDRINSYQDYAIQAMIKGDATEAGVNAVRDLVKKANTQMDSMEPIGPFGKRGRDIALDMASIQGALGDASEFETVFGTGKNKVGFQTKISDGINEKIGRSYLAEVTGFANSEDMTKRLDALNDQQFRSFYASINASRSAVTSPRDMPDGYVTLDVRGLPGSDIFEGLYLIDEYKKNRYKGTDPTDTDEVPQSDELEVKVKSIAEVHKQKTGAMPATVGMFLNTETGVMEHVVLPKFEGEANILALNKVAEGMGVKPINALARFQTGWMTIPNISSQEQIDTFNAAIELGKIPNVEKLDPDESLYMMSQKEAMDIIKKAQKGGATSVRKLGYALAVYMQRPDPTEPKSGQWGTQKSIKPEMIQTRILMKVFGTDEEGRLVSGVKFKDLRDAQTALEATDTRIAELQAELLELKKKDSPPIGFDAYVGKLYAMFSPEKGVFGGLLGALGLKNKPVIVEQGFLDLQNEEDITKEYSDYLQKGIESKGVGTDAARLEAMRISLAFEMARAADPSGRLSNQDIEMQLRKLGTNWQTIDQAIAAVGVARKEFAFKKEQYKVFVSLGESQKAATTRDYKIIDGMIAADYLMRRSLIKQTGLSSDTADKPVDISNIVRHPSGMLLNQTGEDVTEDQKKEFEKQEALKKVQDAAKQSGTGI